jgi:PAS domain S-box-containing protein
MKFSTRLTTAMVALVLLTATTIGLLTYRDIVALVVPRALDLIDSQARANASVLEASIRGVRADVIGFRSAVAVDGIVRASVAGGVHPLDGTTVDQWRDRLAARFVAELNAKPSYSQFRLIGVAEGGRELLRVDRSGAGGAIRVVPDAELQRKGDRDYFKKTIGLPAGEVHVSPIELNQEYGRIEIPHVPTLRAAAPLFAPDGARFGLVIINVDLRPAFAHIHSIASGDGHVYVVNERGDYLLHPDRSRTFGFEFGNPVRVQDDFPEFTELLATNNTAPLVIENRTGARVGVGMERVQLAGGPWVTVIQTMPYSQLMAAATAVRHSSLLGGLAAVLCAFALAVLLARSLTRPLVEMTKEVEAFAHNETMTVPTRASREVGVLATAFARMATEVREKTAALTHEIQQSKTSEEALRQSEQMARKANVELKQRDRQLTEQGERFETALNSMRQGLLMFDNQSQLILCNQRYLQMYGLGPDTAKPGCTLRELLVARKTVGTFNGDPDQYIAKSVNHGKVETKVVSLPDGRIISVTNAPAPGGGWVSTHDDISERRLAEEERDRIRTFLDTIIENVPATIVVKDAREHRYVLVNRHGEEFFGMSRSEMIGKNAGDFFPQEQAEVISARDKEALRSRPQLLIENSQTHIPRRGMRVITTKRVAIRDSNGEPQYLLAFIDDVTEYKRAEEALRDSEQMARGIIDTALDAFVQMDDTGRITEWNPQAEAIFGWTPEEVIGKSLAATILPENDRDRHVAALERFLRTGEWAILNKRLEIEAIRRDGSQIKVELAVTALPRRSGYLFNGFIRDITEKVAKEEQFRQAQKMEAVGQLTGGIAHDFNNMLTVIIGTAEILAEAVADNPELVAVAKMIDGAAEHGADLTKRLLAFARKQPLQPQETDINNLTLESAKLLGPALGENIEIETRLVEDAWPALIDPSQLSSALVNLGVNARDAMPEGGKLTLETANVILDEGYVSAHQDIRPGTYVMIAVTDTGAGIPAELRDKVFEPFFTTKEVGKGTGLGLSMVYGFVKQSGGHIKIYSEQGHGTTIKLYLPRAGADADCRTESPQQSALRGGSETILLVEDNELVRQQVALQLESLGYVTLPAANAGEALALLDGGAKPNLLFTDVIMPGGMNGPQLAQEVIKRHPAIKVLYTSGYTENAMIHQGRLDPAVLLLAKPYRKAELARLLRMALGKNAEADEPARGPVARVL